MNPGLSTPPALWCGRRQRWTRSLAKIMLELLLEWWTDLPGLSVDAFAVIGMAPGPADSRCEGLETLPMDSDWFVMAFIYCE
jgi:hypothetical protein